MGFLDRLQHGWNAFTSREPTNKQYVYTNYGTVSSFRPDRFRFSRGNERSIVTTVYNRIALDVAGTSIRHVKLDNDYRFSEFMNSCLDECLSLSANKDQTGRAFIQDVVMSVFDEGCIAIVPTDTYGLNPNISESFDVEKLRTGKIIEWYPDRVKVNLYNENTGKKEDVILSKDFVGIIENPFYAVMNEPNSTAQRLIRKLNILDAIDEQSGSGKLDLIIQLPYVVKTDARRQQAETRRKNIEEQLSGSKYGIAYTDGTEKITQLNRSVDNQLMAQIEYLTSMLYSQLSITTEILNGTANEQTMLNYYNRTIEPVLAAIADEMKRKFLSKKARSQKQTIFYYRDPFKLVPATQLAEIADKLTRNEIVSSNEMRQAIGMRPSNDPYADQLRNSNISRPVDDAYSLSNGYAEDYEIEEEGEIQNER